MGVRENKVERYLDEQVRLNLGGETRAWKKSNRDGVPDQIVIYPDVEPTEIHFVEVKTTDGEKSPTQIREQERLSELNCIVTTVYGSEGVDSYISDVLWGRPVKEEYR